MMRSAILSSTPSMKPFLIGIAGPSCSGKTELARALSKWLPGGAPVVTLDSYYHPLDHLTLEERSAINFDHPRALDWARIEEDVKRLSEGQPINEPVYLFDKHTRAAESQLVEPKRFVVVEGLFVLHSPVIRNLLSGKFFVNTPDEECYRRRLNRDTVERGRTEESICSQYIATVRPMAEAYVLPTMKFADLVVPGNQPMARSIELVKEHLAGCLPLTATASAGA